MTYVRIALARRRGHAFLLLDHGARNAKTNAKILNKETQQQQGTIDNGG